MNYNQNELQLEIRQFLADSNWSQQVQDQVAVLENALPPNPWIYLAENPTSIAHQFYHLDVKMHSLDSFRNRLLELLVDQAQITKIKRAQMLSYVSLMFSTANMQILSKYLAENYDEILNLDQAIPLLIRIFKAREVQEAVDQFKKCQCPITWAVLHQFYTFLPNTQEPYQFEQLLSNL